jgi:cytochrome c553
MHHGACLRSGGIERPALTLFGLIFVCGLAAAQANKGPVKDFQATLWASSCMACHGTDGKAEGTGIPIGGRPAEELHTILLDYKTDKRQGTVMHQHAKGYSDDELKRIAQYFSRVK